MPNNSPETPRRGETPTPASGSEQNLTVIPGGHFIWEHMILQSAAGWALKEDGTHIIFLLFLYLRCHWPSTGLSLWRRVTDAKLQRRQCRTWWLRAAVWIETHAVHHGKWNQWQQCELNKRNQKSSAALLDVCVFTPDRSWMTTRLTITDDFSCLTLFRLFESFFTFFKYQCPQKVKYFCTAYCVDTVFISYKEKKYHSLCLWSYLCRTSVYIPPLNTEVCVCVYTVWMYEDNLHVACPRV